MIGGAKCEKQTRTILSLPPEILGQVLSHVPTAASLRNISLSCRTLRAAVERDGWRTFVERRFPSFHDLPPWQEAAQRLTSLSRAFDRKALIVSELKPDNPVYSLPDGEWRPLWGRSHGPRQTMGYRPSIDSCEVFLSRKPLVSQEILALGAGAELLIKLPTALPQSGTLKKTSEGADRKAEGDAKQTWIAYHERQHAQGRDDITTVNLLRPHQFQGEDRDEAVHCIAGRASGELSLITTTLSPIKCVTRRFETGDTSVRAAHLSPTASALLAACLGDERAAIYPVVGDGSIAPISEIHNLAKHGDGTRTWSTRFLNESTLAIGRGVSKNIVLVYAVTPDGFSDHPLRTFGTGQSDNSRTAVYPLVGLPTSSASNDSRGDLFLSGGYDGNIRLHDMRSSLDTVSIIADPTHDAPIFSLDVIGRERIIAGTAMHSLLKVFDLRMNGGRNYSYVDISGRDSFEESRINYEHSNGVCDAGWNLYTSRISSNARRVYVAPSYKRSGPIYSISRPSSSSPSIYLGLENNVLHMDMCSIAEKMKDPAFLNAVRQRPITTNTGRHQNHSVSPIPKAMYMQTSIPGVVKSNQLLLQKPISTFDPRQCGLNGLDERWQLPLQFA